MENMDYNQNTHINSMTWNYNRIIDESLIIKELFYYAGMRVELKIYPKKIKAKNGAPIIEMEVMNSTSTPKMIQISYYLKDATKEDIEQNIQDLFVKEKETLKIKAQIAEKLENKIETIFVEFKMASKQKGKIVKKGISGLDKLWRVVSIFLGCMHWNQPVLRKQVKISTKKYKFEITESVECPKCFKLVDKFDRVHTSWVCDNCKIYFP